MAAVQVLADGNPRVGGMDADERDQCIHDIVSWFQRKTELKAAGEKSSELEALEKALGTEIPEALRSLLAKQSSGIWFDEFKSLCADDIMNAADKLSSIKGWKSSYVPFAADADGTYLISDVAAKNAVSEFSDDGKGKQLSSTLSQYLEDYRNRLLSGHFDYVEDIGLVERSRK
ncbi:TPA: hypothetical protein N0F65_012191 [Lagenidium giganteum]|uniref:Knr4/Smi1-like domain-containing protein n=1 Tax=Lagenidium giganteum TaxID=4803 RepID=A0AAV2ZIS1_9STRA|nr:TPA: hypothetical protein N0F65_012191 [Lagenidium giganteum]